MKLIAALIFIVLLPTQTFAAVAFDVFAKAADTANPGGTTLDVSITTAGSNEFLLACIQTFKTAGSGDLVSSVVLDPAGVNTVFTLVDKTILGSNNNYRLTAYRLFGATAGAHTVRTTLSGAANFLFEVNVSSYNGVNQTALDSQNKGTLHSNAAIAATTTTVADNAWAADCTASDDNDSNVAGANTTIRGSDTPYRRLASADNNAAKTPAGTATVNTTMSATTADSAYIIISLAPIVSVTTVPAFFPKMFIGRAVEFIGKSQLFIL